MQSAKEPKKPTDSVNYTHKTKEDFLRWLKKQKTQKKQGEDPEESADQSNRWR